MNDYQTITAVIEHIITHKLQQQSLSEIADSFGVSSGHLQKMFTNWVGVTPKQFGRYISLQYAKELLANNKTNTQTCIATGLSSTGRLHDLFVDIEAMTPGEYKNGAINIVYSIAPSPFGQCLVASTRKGICNILFADTANETLAELQNRWPVATIQPLNKKSSHNVVRYFLEGTSPDSKIKLHLQGTNFQIKIWEALLSIPEGSLASYGDIAAMAGDRKMARAAGAAIGSNPIGNLIPCHRVLKSSGEISGYRWGVDRKRSMLLHEAIRTH